jgi:hypothetical protein
MEEHEYFNLEQIYDEQVAPLIAQIVALCEEHRLPMMASFIYEHSEETGTGACTTLINDIPGRKFQRLVDAAEDAMSGRNAVA